MSSSSCSHPGRLSKSRNGTRESRWADGYPENTAGDQHSPSKPLGEVWKEASSSPMVYMLGPQNVPDLIVEKWVENFGHNDCGSQFRASAMFCQAQL